MQAQAQTAPAAPRPVSRPNASLPGAGGLAPRASMDLSSVEQNSFAEQLGQRSIGINVNGRNQMVNGATPLTPAQRMAAYQVYSTGKQSLEIGEHGDALRGNFSLGRAFANNLESVVVPRQVDMYHDFRLANTISIVGDLINNGRILGYSTSPNVTTGIINAGNIINNEHALITTVPSHFGNFSVAKAQPVLNLDLNADHSFINHGVVASSGRVSITAGDSLVNTSSAASPKAVASIQAAGNVNLRSGLGGMVNNGSILSEQANVNMASQAVHDLAVNNIGGRIEALAGHINIGDANCTAKTNTTVTGGSLAAKEVNLFAGGGDVSLHVDSIEADKVNATGDSAHLTVNSGNLKLGDINLAGDPTFYNHQGNIYIAGNIVVGEDLTIAAANTIYGPANGNFTIAARGYNINLIAGAKFYSATGSPSGVVGGGYGVTAGPVTIMQGTPGTGGNIDFLNGSVMVINSAGGTAGQAGGNIRLIAYPNSAGTYGRVLLPAASHIISTGNGAGANGDVSVIAGGSLPGGTGNTIMLGRISSNNGISAAGGAVNIANAKPTFTSGSIMTFNNRGAIVSGNDFNANLGALGVGSISLASPINANYINVRSGDLGTVTVAPGQALTSRTNVLMTLGNNATLANYGTLTPGAAYANYINGTNSYTLNGSGTFNGTTNFAAPNTITLSNGTNYNVAGTVSLQTPAVIVGSNGQGGSISATINALNSINLRSNALQTGQLAILKNASAQSGRLNLLGAPVTTTSDAFVVGANTTVATNRSGNSFNITAAGSNSVSLPGSFTGTIENPGTTTVKSSSNVYLGNGANVKVNGGALNVQSPALTVGVNSDFGNATATLQASSVSMEANTAQTGALSINTNGASSSGTLIVGGGAPLSTTSDSFAITDRTTVATAGTIKIASRAGSGLSIPASFTGTLVPGVSTKMVSDTEISLGNGAYVSNLGPLTLQAPQIKVGSSSDYGYASASINAPTLSLRANATDTGSLVITTGPSVSSGSLSVSNGNVSSISDSFSLNNGVSLFANEIAVSAKPGNELMLPSSFTGWMHSYNGSPVSFTSTQRISLGNNFSLSVNGPVLIETPEICVGTANDSGFLNAQLLASGYTLRSNSAGTGALVISAGPNASYASLSLNGNGPITSTSDSFSINDRASLRGSYYPITISSQPGRTLTLPGTFVGAIDMWNEAAPITFSSDTGIVIGNGFNLQSYSAAIAMQSPQITLGTSNDSGYFSASLNSRYLTFRANANGTGSLSFSRAPQLFSTAGLMLGANEIRSFSDSFSVGNQVNLSLYNNFISEFGSMPGRSLLLPSSFVGNMSSYMTPITFKSDTAIVFAHGLNIDSSFSNDLVLNAPSFVIGSASDYGFASARVSGGYTGKATLMSPNGAVSITTAPGVYAGTLYIDSRTNDLVTSSLAGIAPNVTVASYGLLQVRSPNGSSLTIPATSFGAFDVRDRMYLASDSNVIFENGLNWQPSTNGLYVQSPTVTIGRSSDVGALTATISGQVNYSIEANNIVAGAGASSAQLNLPNGGGLYLVTNSLSSLAPNVTINVPNSYTGIVVGPATGSLAVPATAFGTLSTTGSISLVSDSNIIIANGANWTPAGTGALIMQSPAITVGNAAAGTITSTINNPGGFQLRANATQTGALVMSTQATSSGRLNLYGGRINSTSNSFALTARTALATNQTGDSINIASSSGNSLTIPAANAGTLYNVSGGKTNFSSGSRIYLANGSSINVSGGASTNLIAPVITVGSGVESGNLSATISAVGAVNFSAPSGSPSINTVSSASTGVLNVYGTAPRLFVNSMSSLASNTTVNSSNSITVGPSTGTLTIPASAFGKLVSTGIVYLYSDTNVNLVNGANWDLRSSTGNGWFFFQSPLVTVGSATDTGAVSATMTAGQFFVQANAAGTGALTITKGTSASSGLLNLFGGLIQTKSDSLAVTSGMTLAGNATNGISVVTNSGSTLTIPSTFQGTLHSPNGTAWFSSNTGIVLANGANVNVTGGKDIWFMTPSMTVGTTGNTGALAATVNGGRQVLVFPSVTYAGNLAFNTVAGASSSQLNLNAPDVRVMNSGIYNTTINNTLASNQAISLNAGTGSILTPAAGRISGSSITLYSSGNLGTSGNPLNTATTGMLNVTNSSSTFGTVNIRNVGSGMTLNNPRSYGPMTVSNSGSMTVLGTGSTTNGHMNLSVDTGNLNIGNGSLTTSLTANNGNITLQNMDTNLANPASINLNKANLKGSSTTPNIGHVNIFFGNSVTPTNPISSYGPNVTILSSGGGLVYAGTNGFTANAPMNTLNAEGRNVVISTMNRPASAITFSGTYVLADPPRMSAVQSATGSVVNTPVSTQESNNSVQSITIVPSTIAAPRANSFGAFTNVLPTTGISMPSTIEVTGPKRGFDPENVVFYTGDKSLLGDDNDSAFEPVAFYGRAVVTEHNAPSHDVKLHRGSYLFAPKAATVVETQFGRINIEAGSVVLVVAQANAVTIFDMHDSRRNGVVIAANGSCIGLAPGQHVTITSDAGCGFEDINPLHALGHRNLHSSSDASGNQVFSSEFSIASALDGLKVFTGMQHSNSTSEQKLIREVMKDAAIIQVIKGSNNTYHRYAPKSSLAANL